MIKLHTIISGGQEGADKTALIIAKAFGYKTGGTCPKGYLIQMYNGESSSNQALQYYGLVEHTSTSYPPRTIKNVCDSDGTLWIGHESSPGGKLTINTCVKHNKPYLINPSVEEFINWLRNNDIQVLNVAGNRVSIYNPLIESQTAEFLIAAFNRIQIENILDTVVDKPVQG